MSQEQLIKGTIIRTCYNKLPKHGLLKYIDEESGTETKMWYQEKSLKQGLDINKFKENDDVLFQIEEYTQVGGNTKFRATNLRHENESEDEKDNDEYTKLLFTDKLTDWAFIFEGKYQELANKALEENWWFGKEQKTFDNGNKDWRILKSYLSTTFTKLYHDKKIEFSENKQYAAFNTGLVERTYYSPIMACFVKNTFPDKKQQWYLQEFSAWEDTPLFADEFSEVPERANYFEDSSNMFLDCELAKNIPPKFDHIIIDNIDRFPLNYLNDTIRGSINLSNLNLITLLQNNSEEQVSSEKKRTSIGKLRRRIDNFCNKFKINSEDLLTLINKKLQGIKVAANVKEFHDCQIINLDDVNNLREENTASEEKTVGIEISEETKLIVKKLNEAISYEILRERLSNDRKLLTKIASDVNYAKDLAIAKTEWNYRTAVPMYYPRANKMMMLLPLYLDETSDDADVALVISKYKSTYIAKTILTLEMAYLDSRLVTRPDSDWLSNKTTENFSSDNEDDNVGDSDFIDDENLEGIDSGN